MRRRPTAPAAPPWVNRNLPLLTTGTAPIALDADHDH
jgi:hypothetical protein